MSPSEVVTIGAACGASDDEVELCVRVAQRAIEAYHSALVESDAAVNELDFTLQQDALKRLGLGAKEAAQPGSPRRLRVRLIVTESVLDSSTGGSRVMAEQLEHLDELSELPGFEFRIVDGDAGPYLGMGTPFTVMRFAENRFDDVVLLRTLHGGDTWLESAAERAPHERALGALDGVVRTEELSSLWLSQTSLRLCDPLRGNDSEDVPRRLQLVTDQARS